MKGGRCNRAVAAGTEVLLARCIGLNGDNGFVHPKAAQRTSASVTVIATATRAMSSGVVLLSRKGLKPIEQTWYARGPIGMKPLADLG